MWEDSLTQPCVITANLQNILKICLKDSYHAVCWDASHWQTGSRELQFGSSD